MLNQVVADEALRAKLCGMREQTEIFDEAGHQLGYFLPAEVYRELLNAYVDAKFPTGLPGASSNETGGRPLAEIWKSLGRT